MMTSLEKRSLEEKARYQNIGFTIRQVGIGDGIQFTSLPENYFRATGEKLIDVSQPWYLDYNPYILRGLTPKKTIELWNYPRIYDWTPPRQSVYLTNAEIHCSVFGIAKPKLIRPRLYQFEDPKNPHDRDTILFHPFGKSHGSLPDFVIEHVLKKYAHPYKLLQIGLPSDPDIGICKARTETLWDLAELISECRMVIGVDSGPAWIASCFPDVVVKKIRTRFQFGFCEPDDWVPLDTRNEHSFWDDQSLFKIYNCFEEPRGFTESYRQI